MKKLVGNIVMDENSEEAYERLRRLCLVGLLSVILQTMSIRRAHGEDRLDFKVMQYQEADGRVSVLSPTFLYKKEFNPDFSIQVDGIFNAISGATPTGAPPVPVYITTLRTVPVPGSVPAGTTVLAPSSSYDREDDDDHDKAIRVGRSGGPRFMALAGATPAVLPQPVSTVAPAATNPGGGSGSSSQVVQEQTPAGSVIPTQKVVEERYGVNLDVTRRFGRNTVSTKLAFSQENDYQSTGIALVDSIDMNSRNTVLSAGVAYTHDVIDVLAERSKKNKESVDFIIGITQYVNPKTVFTSSLSFGMIDGYLSDQYKVVELNGLITSERRPDSKTKETLFVGLTRRVDSLAGAAELGYRFYQDSFDIMSHTLWLNWYQDLGEHFVLRPSIRFYDQSASSFYDNTFTGTPEFFSSDYRVSALNAYGYGLKLIWFPNERYSCDVAFERYEQQGKDGTTDDRMYPAANIITIGGRIWL